MSEIRPLFLEVTEAHNILRANHILSPNEYTRLVYLYCLFHISAFSIKYYLFLSAFSIYLYCLSLLSVLSINCLYISFANLSCLYIQPCLSILPLSISGLVYLHCLSLSALFIYIAYLYQPCLYMYIKLIKIDNL